MRAPSGSPLPDALRPAPTAASHHAHPSIPIVPVRPPPPADIDLERLDAIASRMLADEPALTDTRFFGDLVRAGLDDGPALVIGDNREIPLIAKDATLFEYRISHLAGGGDFVLLSGNRNSAFEEYRERFLGLGPIEIIEVPESGKREAKPLAARCRERKEAMDRLAGAARRAGRFTVVPHIGMGHSWLLAGSIAKQAKVPVRVCAPPPRLTRRVNDKLWFAHCVQSVLGARARPPLRRAFGPAALVRHVASLAKRSARVAIKVPDSAGSAGNFSLAADEIRGLPPDELCHRVLQLLNDLGWEGTFPLLVEVWDSPVLADPSVQLWIPHRSDGLPVIEGIFEQVVEGPGGEFVGSRPATIPQDWMRQIMREALQIAALLQRLGYFGRCSFDAVLGGQDYAHAELHWIECNGRWGGVSVPMTLANRLMRDRGPFAFVVMQRSRIKAPPRDFAAAQELVRDLLFDPSGEPSGVVLLTPHGIERGTATHLMAIAPDAEHALALARQAAERLTDGASVSKP